MRLAALVLRMAWLIAADEEEEELAALLANLPAGQVCPTTCFDTRSPPGMPPVRCPSPRRFTGANHAPEIYVGNPDSVTVPPGNDPRCDASMSGPCCACGGGTVGTQCPAAHELTLSVSRLNNRTWNGRLFSAGVWPEEWYAGRWAEFPGWSGIIGAAVDSVAAPPPLPRRDFPSNHGNARVRIISTAEPAAGTTEPFVVRFYFANWHAYNHNALELEANFMFAVAANELWSISSGARVPSALRVAPVVPTFRDYPNSIAWATHAAGNGYRERICSSSFCRHEYTHPVYPPYPRDLSVNTSEPPGGVTLWGGPMTRPLVPGGATKTLYWLLDSHPRISSCHWQCWRT